MKTKEITLENLPSVSQIEDLKAIKAIKTGDRNAFAKIYNKYKKYILQKFTMKLRGNTMLAEDLVAEVFVKVYLKLPEYSVDYTFNSWLTRIAENHLVDYVRQSQKMNLVSIDSPVSNSAEPDETFCLIDVIKSEALDAEAEMIAVEQKLIKENKNVAIRKVVDAMDEPYKGFIIMRYYQNMTYEEMCEAKSKRIEAVKVAMWRAHTQLSKAMKMAAIF